MESGNGGASSKGFLVPVSDTSDEFQNSILAPLQSAYLYEESHLSFKYKSAVLVKNPALEKKYNSFRAKRRAAGYSEEDLEETYGFLLFDEVSEAHALGETGVHTRNGTCTTLGDPCKGVYISMYSDCLDLNRWYHGKSGYIAIIRLTKGKVKKVLENYTQNFTAPSVGFDCHVSEQLPLVSAQTSSFLAFERTQYYMYELIGDESDETAQSPSAACPFAIVSFSYTDTNATFVVQPETSEKKKQVCHHLPWRGKLQIGNQFYNVALRSTGGALIPAKLPPVLKVDTAISMSDLIQLLPKGVFETFFSGEVSLDNLYCSVCELISSEVEETNSLSLLLEQIKEKDLALPVLLNDRGFLILLHSSHFFTYDDTGSNETEVLQGMFVFPDSRAIQTGTKSGQRKATTSSDILWILPVLTYAESEAEKTLFDASEELCEVLAQQIQNYVTLINPGLPLSPSREVNMFPDQYDVLDTHNHLYSTPDWTNRAWENLRSYMSKPVSFQLPVSRASEILAAGQEERREDLDDDVYICPSSPEEAPASPVDMGSDDKLSEQTCPVNSEAPAHSYLTSAGAQVDSTTVPQSVASDDLQAGNTTKDKEKTEKSIQVKTDDAMTQNLLIHPTSDDLSAELIVSITSAEQTLTDESISVISTVSATKQNEFQLSGFSAAKLQTAEAHCLHDETVEINNKENDETNVKKRKGGKLHRRPPKGFKKASKASGGNISLQTAKIPEESDISMSQKDEAKELSGNSKLNVGPLIVDWRKLPRRRRKFGKLSTKSKKVRAAAVRVAKEKNSAHGQQSSEGNVLMELEICPLRKKTERWDIKPVVSECGRILVPFGSVHVADPIMCMKDKPRFAKDKQHTEKLLVDGVNAHDGVHMEQDYGSAPEAALDERVATTSKDGANHLQNVVTGHNKTEHRLLTQSDDGLFPLEPESNEHSLNIDSTDASCSEPVREKLADTPSQGMFASKGDFLLNKLKSVILRGKRKNNFLVSDGTTMDTAQNTAQNTEPCMKKGKGETDAAMLKSNDAISSLTVISESVDPLFAYALGLTPRVKPIQVQESKGQDSQVKEFKTETKEQTLQVKHPEIIQRPPSIFQRRSRIKKIRRHQGIPTEYIKKKWWLHFQTPACFATEKLKYKEYSRDNSVRKTVKERVSSSCSSTDALNLLADLALGAGKDQLPPQPDPALAKPETKPETSLKKCGLTKDVTSAEQESVLHALLRQPAAIPTQPFESHSPSHLAGESELVGLISKEHTYSLPPSSPLPLGLPGTPFQVYPLSGSTRLLHTYQQLYGDGIQTLHPTVCHEDKLEHNRRTPEHLKKHMLGRKKFRNCRTFVKKGTSVQVTREWNENYDFNRDSRFSNDLMDRTVIRALHGPWDYSIQDTAEEVQLIVHIWIGLFYSRSTARFFQMDSNVESSEGSDSVEMSTKMVPAAPAVLELKANSFGASSTVTDKQDPSHSKALDLSKKDNSSLDKESAVLDLSLRNCNAETVTSDPQINKRGTPGSGEPTEASETVNSMESSMVATLKCHKTMLHSTEKMNDMSKVRDIYEEDKASSPSQNAGFDKASFKVDGLFSPLREETENALLQRENVATASGTGHGSHGCNEDDTSKNDDLENPKISLAQKHEKNSCKSIREKYGESNKEADKVAPTDEHDYMQSKVNWEVKENSCQEGKIEASPEVIDQDKESTNEELGKNCLKNEKQISREEPKSVSSSHSENDNEDVDCGIVHAGEITTGQDGIGEDNVLDERDCCISADAVEGDLSEQPLPMMFESPASVKKDCITDCCCQAPSQADHEDAACRDFQLRELPTNGHALAGEQAILKAPVTLSEMVLDDNQPTSEDRSENDIYLADKVQHQMVELPTSLESCQAESLPKTKDSLEAGRQNMITTILHFGRSSDHTTSAVEKKKDGNTAQEEAFHSNPHSPQNEAVKKCEAFEALTKETNLAMKRTNEGLEKGYSGILIPFIGLDISGEDILQPNISEQQSKFEEAVQSQKEMPIINKALYSDMTREICSKSETHTLSADKVLLLGTSETNHEVVSGSEYDNRCPTPTLDERPYDCVPCSGPCRSTSALSSNESYESTTHECLSSSKPVIDEMPCEQKLHTHSTVGSDQKPLHPDLELRTLRVLQSIDKLFYKPNHTDKANQLETAHMKNFIDQTVNLSTKHTPACVSSSHTSADFKKMSNKPVEASPSSSHELHKESPNHFIISPFKSKLEEVLGVRLQLKKTDSPLLSHNFERADQMKEASVGQNYCHSYTSIPSEGLQTFTSNINQDGHKTPQQPNLNLERSYSQRPVMAVKPSKSDESQVHCIFKDGKIQYSAKSNQTKTPVATNTTPTTTANNTEHFRGKSGLIDNRQESRETCLSNVIETKSNSEKAKLAFLDPADQYQGKDTKISPSSLSTQSFESAKSDGHQGFLSSSLLEKVQQATEENREVDQIACSEASSSFVEHKDSSVIDDLEPQSSLVCTIFNTSRKRSHSFLEQVSQQCLQDDITQVSMEQESLIFSEQMKQLLKKNKREDVCQKDSCTSPVTVCFSSLEEQEDSGELLDTPLLDGQKFKVDVSDRKSMADSTEERTLHPQKSSPGRGNLKECAGVSDVTAECVRSYEEKMNDICAAQKVQSRPTNFTMDTGYKKPEPSNHFDFCYQMKREMDESFRSCLNSVVKKSCKTKNKFYILVTSDDALFEETKAQLEAQGHTAVQQSEFFFSEDSSSSLLIILRNEDIAEHICEVPHLLELKKSQGVQFVGIDEPDDVVNLTYQELFVQGGFIMFDMAVLDTLNICDMKKFAEVLRELRKTGKWKWMLHYRDSRRLKEKSRVSEEAKEKKHFLNSCLETGVLEVLPYHECDLMSRDQPDYLTCLIRLQVQNISARYPIFITDTTANGPFGRNGILTMTVDSFLTNSTNERFGLT